MNNGTSTMNKTKPIDWGLCLELANNRTDFAKEMLSMFINDLEETRSNILKAYEQQDWEQLQQQVHRLHGACCYCGVPELKTLSNTIETKLKQDQHTLIDTLITQLDKAINDVQASYQAQDYID